MNTYKLLALLLSLYLGHDSWGVVIGQNINLSFSGTMANVIFAPPSGDATVSSGATPEWQLIFTDYPGVTLSINMDDDTVDFFFTGTPSTPINLGTLLGEVTFTEGTTNVPDFTSFEMNGNSVNMDPALTNTLFTHTSETLTIDLSGIQYSKGPGSFSGQFGVPEPGSIVLVGMTFSVYYYAGRKRKRFREYSNLNKNGGM